LEEKNSSSNLMSSSILVSLVIPVFNESSSIEALITSIDDQTRNPDEVILVDGGSTDDTVELAKRLVKGQDNYRIIEAGRAMPGKGRNIGAENAKYEWIAFTDAGIHLDKNWLEHLVKAVDDDAEVSIIYGNYAPVIDSNFEKAAAITYVPPQRAGTIRSKSIVSCLLKKEVWQQAGGFPDLRATEDLIFLEKIETLGYKISFAPAAMAYWELRPDMISTFNKFKLYSVYNVWAGRQAHWHYGVARQYLLMMVFLTLAIFHSWIWILFIPAWFLARTAKRIIVYRYELGWKPLFNPLLFLTVTAINFSIDMATFSGWLKAVLTKKRNIVSKY
jgi:glycosyltransferase involved in cell wall biosynthesis